MFNLIDVNVLKYFTVCVFIAILSACSSDSGDSTVFDPTAAPQNVQVVSGDDDSTEARNTISWTRDPAATDYVVYVDNKPGVTESSSVVVPAASGFTYVTHSGVDVVEGTTYYYRVKAMSGSTSSILSDEVNGTPQQSQTNNGLNDVAWNGSDTLVAVGDQGTILSSPNGMADAWTVRTAGTNQSLAGVTWDSDNTQFLVVGVGSTILTGNGTTWNTETNTATTASLEDVAWLDPGYIAVGTNGTIITGNADGSIWTSQSSNIEGEIPPIALKGVASNGSIIVAVGTNGTILTSTDDGVNWAPLTTTITNNDLNDISWDGNQFGVVGSNDTILTSPDGLTWTSHIPGTPNITFVGASQWDSSLPTNPVLGAVGSAGTFVVSPDATTGFSVPTGTNNQLSGMTWVDVTPPYFVMVGNDGTVLTSQLQ